MKLAFSTNAYTRVPLIEALRGIRAAGFSGVEILADVPHAWPDAVTDTTVGEVSRELKNLGLEVSNINANCAFGYWKDAPAEPYFEPSLLSPTRRHREDRIRLILSAMEFGRSVGAENISITSGGMLEGMGPAAAAAQFAESIKPILGRAEQIGMNLGIECEPGLFIEYVMELAEWINKLNSARLGANLDIGHSVVMGESIREAIRMLRGRIWNMHVEDLPGRKHYHMVPGEGTMDWDAVRDVLAEIGYERYLTVEVYPQVADPQSAAERSYRFLAERFGK